MKKNDRWMKWVLAESAKTDVVLPGTRSAKLQRKAQRFVSVPKVKTA